MNTSQQTVDRMAEIAKAQTKKVNVLKPVAQALLKVNPVGGLDEFSLRNLQHLASMALAACERYDE